MGLHGSWSFVANLVGKEARGETRRSHPRRGLREELSTPTLAGGRTGERGSFFPPTPVLNLLFVYTFGGVKIKVYLLPL